MKNKIVLFITSCFTLVMSSCLKTEEAPNVELIKDCQISSFSLASDSVAELSKVVFTIDQLNGRIFNIDSMPFGTKIEKVLCTLKYASTYTVSGTEVSPDAYPDSTYYWNGTDSINFAKPVRFVVHAYDGIATKVYRAQVNIHQVVPDSMVWGKYADPMVDVTIKEQKVVAYTYDGKPGYLMYVKPAGSNKPYQLYHAAEEKPGQWEPLSLSGLPADGVRIAQMSSFNGSLYVSTLDNALYSSKNGLDWMAVENAPSVKCILGEVKEGRNQSAVLSMVVEKDGVLTFYAMSKSAEWSAGNVVPTQFPVSAFGKVNYAAMYYEYLLVVGGRDKANQLTNTSWATADGKSWSLMASSTQSGFTQREGAMVVRYDDTFFMIGGIDASGKALKDIHTSMDNGITWVKAASMITLPADYTARGFASITVDNLNFVNIFGGKTSLGANDLNQLWRGRINRLVPKQ